MIKDADELLYITNPDTGKEEPYRLLTEIEKEDTKKKFVFYCPITDDFDTVYCAESITLEDGSLELRDVVDACDMAFCEEVFESLQDEIDAIELSDEDDKEEDQ